MEWLDLRERNVIPHAWRQLWALNESERLRLRCFNDAAMAIIFGLDLNDLRKLIDECDYSSRKLKGMLKDLNPKGFWRVDKDKDPELRHTIITLVAFHDLEQKIRDCGADREKGIEAFLNQNNGEGWMLPETLRLSYYGLGHDERAKHPQPVASRLGPRFYDWQFTQNAEESWRECHLHARNILGEEGYRKLLEEISHDKTEKEYSHLNMNSKTSLPKVAERHGPLFAKNEDIAKKS